MQIQTPVAAISQAIKSRLSLFRRASWRISALLVSVFLLSSPGYSLEPVPVDHQAFIDGYSPVSYFTEGKAERGSIEFAVSHNGTVYYLTSEDQVELFNENPDRYQPRYETCSFSLSTGMKKSLDPTNFKLIGDTLLLFHKSGEVDGLEAWHLSPLTDQELLDLADNQVTLLRF